MAECSVEGCTKSRATREWCYNHYRRWRLYGDPLGGRTFKGEPMAWIQALVAEDPNECRCWPYHLTRGYGRIHHAGRDRLVSHVVLELTGRPRPGAEFEAAHAPVICHNSVCCTPRHLRWATKSENMADRWLDGTNGNGTGKLDDAAVADIRSRYSAGDITQETLAAEYGVRQTTVSKIILGQRRSENR